MKSISHLCDIFKWMPFAPAIIEWHPICSYKMQRKVYTANEAYCKNENKQTNKETHTHTCCVLK